MKKSDLQFTPIEEVPEGTILHTFMHMESREGAAMALDRWVSDMLHEAAVSPQGSETLSAFISAYLAIVGDPLGKALACGNTSLTGEVLQQITEEIGRMLAALLQQTIPMHRADLEAMRASHDGH